MIPFHHAPIIISLVDYTKETGGYQLWKQKKCCDDRRHRIAGHSDKDIFVYTRVMKD